MENALPPTGTRADLINAALHLFGRYGFAATSTRALAQQAGTNIASIKYHFGSKEALRLACAEEVLRRIRVIAGPADAPPQLSPQQASQQIELLFRAITAFLTRAPEAADTAGFLMREMTEGGPVLDLLHERFLGDKHHQLCQLFAMVTGGDPEGEETRLLVFSMLGQAIYFRIGQPVICRVMGWKTYGEAEAQAIADRLITNLRATLGAVS